MLLRKALNLPSKGRHQLRVRSPLVSSLDPPSLDTTKGLPSFGIQVYLHILIF